MPKSTDHPTSAPPVDGNWLPAAVPSPQSADGNWLPSADRDRHDLDPMDAVFARLAPGYPAVAA